MNLAGLIMKNVLRQKTRTALTLLGISIGIATIIALGAVADGMRETFGGIVQSGEADFTVAQAGASDMAFSRVDESQLRELEQVEGIKAAEGVSFGITQFDGNPYFIALGLTERGFELGGFEITHGRRIEAASEILLGKLAASNTGLGIGDTITLFDTEYDVVGIYETGEQMQDGATVLDQAEVQAKTDTPGQVTLAFVSASEGADISELTTRIDSDFAGELITIKSADEISRVDQGGEVIDAASWMISALAIVIGGIGVMNTMIISVFDRIREIGVLKAVGWRRRTVMAMVLGEAVIIGLAAVVIGSGLAMLVLVPLSNYEVVASFLKPAYSWALWGRATAVAIIVSLVGGAYPAWRAANLSPVEALRYE